MKKILILTITLVSLLSCSDDEKNLDPIIGIWYTFSVDGKEVPECAKQFYTIFKENGDYVSNNFEITPNNSCNKLEVITAKWEKKNSTTYTLTRGNEKADGKATFSNNNNTLTLLLGESVVYKRK